MKQLVKTAAASLRLMQLYRGSTQPGQAATKWVIPLSIVAYSAIILLLPIHAFISTWGGTAIGPLLAWKSWKEILLTALVVPVIIYCAAHPALAKTLWRRKYNQLIILYLLLHLVLSIRPSTSAGALTAGLIMNIRFLAFFVFAQIITASGHSAVQRLKKLIPTWLLIISVLLAVIAVMQTTLLPKDFLLQFGYNKDATIAPYTLLDDNPNALRAFATMRGPNTLGAYLLIPLAFALYNLAKRRQLMLSALATGLGLIALGLTGSRSAWIGCIVMVFILAITALPRATVIKWLKITAFPAIAISIIFLWSAINVPSLRLAIFHSSPGDPSLFEGSTQNHWAATTQGIKDIIAHPLGTSPGAAGPASFYSASGIPRLSENYFVQIGQEVGILGLGIFIAISVLVGLQLFQQQTPSAHILLASFIGLSAIGLFLHVWADDPTALTWWGIAGLFIADSSIKRHNKGK